MAKRIPDDERERIIAAFSSGKSCNQLAKEFGRSPQTISNIARSVGHQFGYLNAIHAHEARKAYGAEWRANARQKLADAFDDLLADLKRPALVYSFGGRDNTYNEHELEKPDAKIKRDLIAAASTTMRTINEMDKAEQGGADDPLMQWIEGLKEKRAARRKSIDDDPATE